MHLVPVPTNKPDLKSPSLRGKSSLPNQNKLLCWEIGWCGLSWLAWIFKSNFHCLIRPYLEKLFSKSLMKLGDRLMTSKSERQRTSGPQKRSKTDFMYCRKFTLRPARNLVKEFRVMSSTSSGHRLCIDPHLLLIFNLKSKKEKY